MVVFQDRESNEVEGLVKSSVNIRDYSQTQGLETILAATTLLQCTLFISTE